VLMPSVEFDHAELVAFWIREYEQADGEADAGSTAMADLVKTQHRLGNDQLAALVILAMGVHCCGDAATYFMALATLMAHPVNVTLMTMYLADKAIRVAEGN
jgi:hypothetical protein